MKYLVRLMMGIITVLLCVRGIQIAIDYLYEHCRKKYITSTSQEDMDSLV